jgi:hypothetical protein
MRQPGRTFLSLTALTLLALPAAAQVLGPCGTPAENEPVAPAASPGTPAPPAPAQQVQRVPLPGERALNFELQAVIGDEIEMIKLSDYDGAWRVVCFYPADFTFV